MKRKELSAETKQKIDHFLDGLYLDAQGPTGTALPEEYVIKIITRFVISLCTAWWSMRELFDYIQNRRSFKEFTNGFNSSSR